MAFSIGAADGIRGRRRFSGSSSTLSEINIVPLVDVVLVLLIIFMLTAHVMEFGLEINVPEVKQVNNTVEELPVVSITRDGRTYLNDRMVNIHQIPADIAKRFKGAKSVYVMADKMTIYDVVANVVAELGDAKFDIKLVAKPTDSSTRR